MANVLLAVGHGDDPNGHHQPGAVGEDGAIEHDLATRIAEASQAVLGKASVELRSEVSRALTDDDPNYVGTTKEANDWPADVVVEVHLDWKGAPRGGFGLYHPSSQKGKDLAFAIASRYSAAGLPQRPNQARDDLYILKRTKMPAVIWEADRVSGGYSGEELARMGEAVASGLLDWLQVEVPTSAPAEARKVTTPYDVVAKAYAAEGGYWVCDRVGGVYSFGAARFYGSIPGLVVAGVVTDPRPIVDMAPRPQGDGYWLLDDMGGIFTFGEARFHGRPDFVGIKPVGLEATPSGNGYSVIFDDGSDHNFGDAPFHGRVFRSR